MGVYYSEFDPYAAQWLRNLIDAGHLPAGDVDERDIREVSPSDLEGYHTCHFFAGIGGWPYALDLAGWDGPVWTGSCPCQPFSSAGRAKGLGDERHLWPAFRSLIAERKPPVVFGEQVASKDGRWWLAGIRADLEKLGYAIGAADLCAAGLAAPHIRQRLFWVADATSERTSGDPSQAWITANNRQTFAWNGTNGQGSYWATYAAWDMQDARRRCEQGSLPLVNGISEPLDDLRAYGNAIVPQVAAEFIAAYMEI